MAQQPTTFGKYLLLDRVQWGGMAEIWRACLRDGDDGIVAIKRLLKQVADDPEMVTMFLNEARIAVQLAHPNIAQVFDLGRVGSDFFLAMEYVSGVDLAAIFRAGLEDAQRAMPIPLVAYVLAQFCEALDFAHRRTDAQGKPLGIIHRDVSPDNCLVTFDGGAKLIDFGVAKLATADKTRVGVVKGKLSYMSPEQVLGHTMDRRADLFSISVVLHEMVTGRRLFRRTSELETLRAVCQAEAPSPRALNPQVPVELERIILRGLHKDREKRFQWCSELASALRAVAAKSSPPASAKLLEQYLHFAFPGQVALERERREAWAKDRRVVGHKVAPWDAPQEEDAGDAIDALDLMEIVEEAEPDLDEEDVEARPTMAVPMEVARATSPSLPPLAPLPRARATAVADALDRLGDIGDLEGDFEIERLTSIALKAAPELPEEPGEDEERPTQQFTLDPAPAAPAPAAAGLPVEGRYARPNHGPGGLVSGTLVRLAGKRMTMRTATALPAGSTLDLLVRASVFKNVMVRGVLKAGKRVGREHELLVELEAANPALERMLAGTER